MRRKPFNEERGSIQCWINHCKATVTLFRPHRGRAISRLVILCFCIDTEQLRFNQSLNLFPKLRQCTPFVDQSSSASEQPCGPPVCRRFLRGDPWSGEVEFFEGPREQVGGEMDIRFGRSHIEPKSEQSIRHSAYVAASSPLVGHATRYL